MIVEVVELMNNTDACIVIGDISVKDESTAVEVINSTRAAVKGLNPAYDVRIRKEKCLDRNDGIASIMKAIVEYAVPTNRHS